MALQIDGHEEINVRIKVVGSGSGSGSEGGASANRGVVAAECKRFGANWLVLDKRLKQEEKHCMEELQCNIVAMKGSHARMLRLNLGRGLHKPGTPFSSSCAPMPAKASDKFLDNGIKHSTAITSLGDLNASFLKETIASSSMGGTSEHSSIFVCERNPLFEKITNRRSESNVDIYTSEAHMSGSNNSRGAHPFAADPWYEFCLAHRTFCKTQPQCGADQASISSSTLGHNHEIYWIPQNHVLEETTTSQKSETKYSISAPSTTRTPQQQFCELGAKAVGLCPSLAKDYLHSSNVKEVVPLFRSSPSIPPPLCSLCQHKAPVFGKPPMRFNYQELEEATNGFSNGNFLADGALGYVHRGVLRDGRVVAVKQLKTDFASSVTERDVDKFLSEVEVLSRAQHRNVVVLIGYCIQGKRKVLIFEYICNGSLDIHLYGQGKPPLDWYARIKIAIGVARGLRYLHEDCRVGFIVHKDLRPNNILLTHDFEPLVGDFRLTRAQAGTSFAVETHVPRSFGYLAPEYIEHGMLTDKADVYAFGVVLLEIITGRKAMDPSQPKGQQFLAEWTRPLLSLSLPSEAASQTAIELDQFLDPHLHQDSSPLFAHQLCAMISAASMCLHRDPRARPTMSKVLRVLEGDTFIDPLHELEAMGSRSGRISHPMLHHDIRKEESLSLRFSNDAVSNIFYY